MADSAGHTSPLRGQILTYHGGMTLILTSVVMLKILNMSMFVGSTSDTVTGVSEWVVALSFKQKFLFLSFIYLFGCLIGFFCFCLFVCLIEFLCVSLAVLELIL